MRVSILTGIKEVINEMTDRGNGDKGITIRQAPITNGTLARKQLPQERIEFLRLFVHLLIKTDFLNERTRVYLIDRYGSYKTAADRIERESGVKVNPSTLQSTVWLDKNKIERYFSSKVLLDVIEYTNTDVAEYSRIARSLIDKYGQSNLLAKNVIIELPECEPMESKFTDGEFNEFMQMLAPYIRSQANFVRSTIQPEFIGYLKYILNESNEELSKNDLQRKNTILALLS